MENQAQQRLQFDAPAGAEPVQRQLASLRTSCGWLLQAIEPHAALIPVEGAPISFRLRRAARTLSWSSAEQERMAFFAERLAPLEAEAETAVTSRGLDAEALRGLAVRLEKASAEALAFFMAMQAEAARAAELSRPVAAEEDSPPRLRARAEIGAAVRARLAESGARKLPAIGLELYRVPDFFDSASCAAIVELIERDLFPSAILGRDIPGFRTSKSCNLKPTEPPVAAFEAKVSSLLGINLRFTEVVQGQRYEVGQEFKPHFDFFDRSGSYYEDVTEQGGQRTWTAMLFLNRPEAGGCTGFPEAGLNAEPEPGTLLVWNNMTADGRPNPYSLHQGMPVEAGLKYILTQWFRERPLAF